MAYKKNSIVFAPYDLPKRAGNPIMRYKSVLHTGQLPVVKDPVETGLDFTPILLGRTVAHNE